MKEKLTIGQVSGTCHPCLAHPRPKRYMLWLFIALVIALTVTTAPVVVYAQGGYPEPVDPYVNDYARILTARDAANIRTLFTDLKRDTGIEAVVVTVNSMRDYGTGDETIESFATHLFNMWGIGDRERNNGVLILVAVGDREMRIELGSGYGSAFNAKMREVINEHMLPSFRRNEYSQGIYRGARAVIGELTGVWPPDPGQPASVPAPAPTRAVTSSQPRSSTSSTGSDVGSAPALVLGGAVAATGAAAFGLTRYTRYRRRRCSNCQTYMVRLDEVSDDVYLDSGQKLEELLASVDYDVWKCPNCGMHTMQGYSRWFASFKSCPKCGYRTLKVTRKTLARPTYTSTGEEAIIRDCRHCDYCDSETVILPMLTRSEDSDHTGSFDTGSFDSGSSSFGGGQSSGDGASGKW